LKKRQVIVSRRLVTFVNVLLRRSSGRRTQSTSPYGSSLPLWKLSCVGQALAFALRDQQMVDATCWEAFVRIPVVSERFHLKANLRQWGIWISYS
jgi:hypothetical protein